MSGILHFACVQNLVWTPVAREIHSAIWDRVGLKIVQGRVREWAIAWNDKAKAFALEQEKKNELRKNDADWCPVFPAMPLPPSNESISIAEKWASLAAIHDVFGFTGDKVLPWPLPEDDHDLVACTEWLKGDAGAYQLLLRRASELPECYAETVRYWLEYLMSGAVPVQYLVPPTVISSSDHMKIRICRSVMKHTHISKTSGTPEDGRHDEQGDATEQKDIAPVNPISLLARVDDFIKLKNVEKGSESNSGHVSEWKAIENRSEVLAKDSNCSAQDALIAVANSWCDAMTNDKDDSKFLRNLSSCFSFLRKVNRMIDRNRFDSIRIGTPPRRILDVFNGIMFAFDHGIRIDRPIRLCEVRELMESNGLPYKPNEVTGIAELVEEYFANRQADNERASEQDVPPKQDSGTVQTGEQSDTPGELGESLDPNSKIILQAMAELQCDELNRTSAKEIIKTAIYSGDEKRAFDQLKRLSLVASKQGRNGGYWMTARGAKVAEKLNGAKGGTVTPTDCTV